MSAFEKMMVYTKTTEYPIYIDDSFNALASAFSEAGLTTRRVFIIADSNTSKLYGNDIISTLSEFSNSVTMHVITPGEDSKSIDVACEIYRRCIEAQLDRASVIVALGGGVVGDLAGFVAATFMRGVAFVQIPTTLLAQVDSSVGGKVAVNFDGSKNVIGSFYQPRFVYSNIGTLTTLPKEDFLSGLAEAVKMSLIYNENYLNFILQNKERIIQLDFEAIAGVVYGSCNIKAEIVLKDEREQNIREILNFGHTFGHGIESVSNFAIPHGHAVAIGCIAALTISQEKGRLTNEDMAIARSIYQYFGLPISVSGYSAEEIYEHMRHDKKSKNGVLTVILLHRPGWAYSDNTLSKQEIMNGLNAIVMP